LLSSVSPESTNIPPAEESSIWDVSASIFNNISTKPALRLSSVSSTLDVDNNSPVLWKHAMCNTKTHYDSKVSKEENMNQ
jgi:hypothetical protein